MVNNYCHTYNKEMEDTTRMSSVSGSQPECNSQSLRNERLRAGRRHLKKAMNNVKIDLS